MTARYLILLALAGLTLSACSPQGPVLDPQSDATPPPSPTPTLTPVGLAADQAWLVQGQNDFVDGSSPVCADEDLLSNPETEFPGIYLEQGPGLPDDWKPGDEYEINPNGILLQWGTSDGGDYSASRSDADAWETFGTFTFERDAQGVISGGSGTGETRILRANGDVENLSDSMTFTVSVVTAPSWCSIPVG